VNLTPKAERLPLGHGEAMLLGQAVPQVDLYPDTPALPLRAEAALEMFGLAVATDETRGSHLLA
ncbi:MAG: hypothetical protein WBA68_12245, partial [Alteraurantiacibacter sp.]